MFIAPPGKVSTLSADATPKSILQASTWLVITLIKNDAGGNVSIGTDQTITTLSGMALATDTPLTLLIAPGTELFAVGSGGTMFSMFIQPHPYIQAIIEILTNQKATRQPTTAINNHGVYPGTPEFLKKYVGI